jgi:hypothetical protein
MVSDVKVGNVYLLDSQYSELGTKVKVLDYNDDNGIAKVMRLDASPYSEALCVLNTRLYDIKFKTGDIVELYKSVFKPNPKAGAHIPLTFVRYTEPKTYEIYLNDKFYDYCHSDCIVKTKDGKEIPGYSPNLKLLDPCLVERHEEVIKCYRDGMRTVVKYYENGQHIGTGCALCDYSDEYDYATGKKLALERLSDNIKNHVFKIIEVTPVTTIKPSKQPTVTLDSFNADTHRINVGDRVKVIDRGLRYDTYTDWFDAYNLHDLLARYQYNSAFAEDVDTDRDTFIVKATGKHLTDNNILYAIEDHYHRVYLMDEKGVKRIDK